MKIHEGPLIQSTQEMEFYKVKEGRLHVVVKKKSAENSKVKKNYD